MFDRQERADQIDPQYLRPILRALLEDRGQPARYARIGEKDVEPPEPRLGRPDEVADILLGPRVRRDPDDAVAILRRLEIGRDHLRAFCREQGSRRAPDAGPRAGDDRDLIRETITHFPLP